jgi:hypothetical protein
MKGPQILAATIGASLALGAVWLWRSATPDVTSPANAAEPASGDRAVERRWVTFEGACDASGAVPVDERHFAVADDEDNVLRVYDALSGGKPVSRTNLGKQLALEKKGSESDIEAATSLGERAFWISSHGRNAKGDEDPNRSLLITTDRPTLDDKVEVQGGVYRRLLEDLTRAPDLQAYQLERAALLAPKAEGGLNIEGLTATPDGTLLIGFRNPVPRGKALIVPLLNPTALQESVAPKFGAPIELDLAGLGVRSLSWWRGSYLIAAGPVGDGGPAHLYRWKGPGSQPVLTASGVFGDANPEAFFTAEANDEILVLSDDGSRDTAGKPCKKLKGRQKKLRRFRGLWLRLPAAPA